MRALVTSLGRWRTWVWIGIAIAAGAIPFIHRARVTTREATEVRARLDTIRPIRVGNTPYRFVNPLLGYDLPERKDVPPYNAIHDAVRGVTVDASARHATASASVYYRDLITGAWFVVGGDERYAPASLAKVPLLIAYLTMAEDDPALLEQRITFHAPVAAAPAQIFAPSERLVPGTSYTIAELLRAMAAHSDNDAAFLLYRAADPAALRAVYSDLGLRFPNTADASDATTIGDYARFFRFLYNSTYLSANRSEEALALLAESTFNRGIVAGTPGGWAIAHKFGERTFTAVAPGGTTTELHDCGIVYHPHRPYLLCIMTKGWSFDDLAPVIQRVAAAVARQVESLSGVGWRLPPPTPTAG